MRWLVKHCACADCSNGNGSGSCSGGSGGSCSGCSSGGGNGSLIGVYSVITSSIGVCS